MTDKTLSSLIGGGGGFVVTSHSGSQQIAPGSSGTILTLTPPIGERIRLTVFSPAATTTVTDLQLNVNGAQLCTGTCSGATSLVGSWCVNGVGVSSASVSNQNWAGYIPEVLGGVDEVITVVATGANTASTIYYGYQTGYFK